MTEHNYDDLVKRYVALQDQRDQLDKELDSIKTELRSLDVGSHDIAGVKVTISPNRRIDTSRVAALYPFESHPELYKLTPDSKQIRENLPPKVVDSLMTDTGEPRVTIR